jgi:hypothetical protein
VAQCFANWALVGDLKQFQPLFVSEIALQGNNSLEAIDRGCAIGRQHFFMLELNRGPAQCPVMAFNVHS